jgi:hypothetical protein
LVHSRKVLEAKNSAGMKLFPNTHKSLEQWERDWSIELVKMVDKMLNASEEEMLVIKRSDMLEVKDDIRFWQKHLDLPWEGKEDFETGDEWELSD